jgi:uncharacterized protein
VRLTLQDLRNYAVTRSLFAETTLARAIERLGFVQADPIRAPARAQDLTLRHRVKGYRAGDLERRYPHLSIEEDHFINYGFMPRRHVALMQPRTERRPWSTQTEKRAASILAFVHERGQVHPGEVDALFNHGSVTNAWGGSSSASTQLLASMHYRGLLRVARRDKGIRMYAPNVVKGYSATLSASEQATQLLAIAIAKYAPLPKRSIGQLASRLRYAAQHLNVEFKTAAKRVLQELPHGTVDSVEWYWPDGESPSARSVGTTDNLDRVRFLAPFDPVVWDRARFELLWGWSYRFEAYTPIAKRKLGYYALPLLWRADVIGFANVSIVNHTLDVKLGFVTGTAPRGRDFNRELEAEIERMRRFVNASDT